MELRYILSLMLSLISGLFHIIMSGHSEFTAVGTVDYLLTLLTMLFADKRLSEKSHLNRDYLLWYTK